ncbi:Ti-type conjugative transfer relaxase TraA [Tsuneonella suprasediminis]|uniref:Ti-type conjugative transfer relaxase TraA n=1 Tax=Tsuneonella suprasediminis TaxID=2306996 RepID=A0A419QZI9_9SPHN|nr:Ti-type conjugative transfer relaxase TraA [Tsuneonella suprasediminis]RJX66081.1 Ti-type conjugative transfer relaxase TraA [Tsuneonella suprasediminis]
MAIFHFSAKVIGRSSGRSAVAAAAYRAGERLHDERIDRTHDFTNKAGVLHSEVMLPRGAPEAFADRATLWNAVEAAEKRKDAQLSREVEFALPSELSKKDNIRLAREFVKAEFVEKGMIADLNVHWDIGEDGKAKPHAHVMLTMREVTKDGFGAKVRDWNKTALIEQWRERWADHVNRALAERDIDARIDHRSLEAQGIALEPQDKIGPAASRTGGRGLEAERIEEHRAIAQRNGARIIASPALALDAITHQQATFTKRELAAFVHRHSDGKEQFDAAYNAVRSSSDLIALGKDGRGQDRFTSRTMIEAEQRLHRAAETMAQRDRHAVNDVQRNAAFASAAKRGLVLSGEQKSAIEHVTKKGGLAVVIGYAGTGKSAMLGVAREAWGNAGYNVRGAALSGIAAEGLENGSGIASRTIASLEHQWGKGREPLTSRDVLVIDEAGMVGTRQMERVLSHAAKAGAKVVLVGDQQQLQAIEAGAAFRAIHERHGGVEISEVRRQLSAWQQDATRQLATGRIGEAIRTYEERGMVHAADNREVARTELIERWDQDRQANPDNSRIILTHTNNEVRELNLMARGKMRVAGQLGADATIKTARGERQFASGDRIIFLRNERGVGVKNGTLGTVEMASAQSMAVRTDDGREVVFDTKDYSHIDHGYAATIHKAQGMTVDRTHMLATPGMDSHSTYVAMSRHRDGLALHYGHDDFADRSKLVRTLSRERGKDMVGDYQPEQAFAELRGISFRERIVEMVRQVPEKAKSIFGNFRPQARQLEPLPTQASTQNDQRRAVERYARALGDIGTMLAKGLPVLPHQKDALEKAGKALDAIRPDAAADLAKALERRPELIAEAAGGRGQEAVRAMSQEAAVRTDPALRSERFVGDWQGLSAARKQLERQGDRAGAARVSEKQSELAKSLERDPQVEGLLRGKTRELGIDPKPERSIANELTATLTRQRTRAFDIGI